MTDTDTGQALLQAVIAEPADDGLRLIYADWLEGQGQCERAEFIRVQCRMEDMRREYDPVSPLPASHAAQAEWASLRHREVELLRAHRLSWAWPLPERLGVMEWHGPTRDLPWQFCRGFIAAVAVPLAAWLRHGPAVVRACPLERVRLTDSEPYWNGAGYGWFTDGRQHPSPGIPGAAALPGDLFLQLDGNGTRHGLIRWKGYRTQAAARAALSAACLAWARAQEGTA